MKENSINRYQFSLKTGSIAVVALVLSTTIAEAKVLNKDELAYGVTNPVPSCNGDSYDPYGGRMDEFLDPEDDLEHMDRLFESMGGERLDDPCYR
ncbi:hypothetical protein H1P_730028 [Hyella patelloides LEGE 07179]|uniref:Uncharacterized protein n=1 Tax=Hyella patelloides LEGE 07179 TaxID=945734 RepID=A0A563W3R8_9CYAN|nr:hypothetical protein [Hyella patelloides]VEP18287.1 hypothetical protein H1P_730028 [Hyella patelloides LEGE 07179]